MDYFPASAGDQGALASVGQHRCVYSLLMCFLPPPDSCCSLHQRIALDDGRDCKTVNKLLPPPPPPHPNIWAGHSGCFVCSLAFVDTSGVCGCTSGFDKVNVFILFSCQVCVFILWKRKKELSRRRHTHTVWGKRQCSQLVVCQKIVQWFSASEKL